MASKWRWMLMVWLATAVVMAACTSRQGGSTQTTTGRDGTTTTADEDGAPLTSTTHAQDTKLVVWADEARAAVVESAAEIFTTDTGVEIAIEALPFGDIRNDVLNATAAGEGPDIFIGAHDWTGELVRAGLISPIGLGGREAEFFPVTLDAFTYEGTVFGVPFAMEAVGLFYNKDLVRVAPIDFGALQAACDELGFPTGDGVPCLAMPAGEPLHQFPFIAGFGGYVFGFENGTYDVTDVGLDSPGAVAGAEFLRRLYLDGYADDSVDYATMAELFNQGAVPFMWTGPWQVEAVDAAGIDYGIATLPLMNGNPPRPFVGVQGFFLNAFGENPTAARMFLLDYLATTETMVQLFEVTNRPPALRSALDELAGDPNVSAFAASGLSGLPLPNLPELEAAWEALGAALAVLSEGSDEPAAVMAKAAGMVRAAVGPG